MQPGNSDNSWISFKGDRMIVRAAAIQSGEKFIPLIRKEVSSASFKEKQYN